jgi:hypothetical protein
LGLNENSSAAPVLSLRQPARGEQLKITLVHTVSVKVQRALRLDSVGFVAKQRRLRLVDSEEFDPRTRGCRLVAYVNRLALTRISHKLK